MTFRTRLAMIAAFGLLGLLLTSDRSESQQPIDPDLLPPAEFDVQSRGPVHEAFAQPGDLKVEAGAIIPLQPPAPIQEAPPEMRPDKDSIRPDNVSSRVASCVWSTIRPSSASTRAVSLLRSVVGRDSRRVRRSPMSANCRSTAWLADESPAASLGMLGYCQR